MLINPEGPPFTFFGTMRLFLKEKNFSKISIFFQNFFLRFLSLKYGADFRRSRLVVICSHVIWYVIVMEILCNFSPLLNENISTNSTLRTTKNTLFLRTENVAQLLALLPPLKKKFPPMNSTEIT